jgi:phosphoglycerate dehydrogenase-like enzyme
MKNNLSVLVLLKPDEPALGRIRALCPQGRVVVGPWIDEEGQTLPANMLREADVLFCEIPPANFEDFDRLKWIQLTSAGYAQVLGLPVIAKGIRVTNGLGVFDIPIAEWNMMMILWWHRNMLDAQASQRARVFDRSDKYQRELRGATVGFYGYGGIARETARMAKALGLKIWVLARGSLARRTDHTYCVGDTGDPNAVLPDRVFSEAEKAEFLKGIDYLIVGVPLTPATRGVIGEKELRLLQPSAVLINCARAHVIEESAYIRCLREKWIRGSSLDVHYAYPLPPQHPLWEMPNVIMTAHISGSSGGTHFLPRIYDVFTQNLARYVAGKPLLNELTQSQLQGK